MIDLKLILKLQNNLNSEYNHYEAEFEDAQEICDTLNLGVTINRQTNAHLVWLTIFCDLINRIQLLEDEVNKIKYKNN